MDRIPTHFNNRIRNIFRKIYNRGQIDVTASKSFLEEQLNLYLDHFDSHTGSKTSKIQREKIWGIIARNNEVAKVLSSPTYLQLTKKEKSFFKGALLGLVFCIDGRIPAIFLGGRFARHFEVPAGELTIIKRKSDNVLIPDSTDLNEALRRASTANLDLLEIVFAHTSLTDSHHGCGAMMAKKRAGLLDPKLSLEEANLEIIQERTIRPMTNLYNEFRFQIGLDPLKVVGIPALYDTDTFGIILNFTLKEESLSTTKLANKYKDELSNYFAKSKIGLGSFEKSFSDLDCLTAFSKNVTTIIEAILAQKAAKELLPEIADYINKYFADLTVNQKEALRFVLIRNIAQQYLTGYCCTDSKRTAKHAFYEHGETYMAVAMRGMTIGKFDPKSQVFAATPSDPKRAIDNINTMLSIMSHNKAKKPYTLFICNSLNIRDLQENNPVAQRIMGSNAGLLRDIVEDSKLGMMIESSELIPVPLLIEETTREVLKIVDHSGYI